MFQLEQLVFGLLLFIRVAVYPRELLKDRIVIPLLCLLYLSQLWQNHALNGAVEIEVNVIKLSDFVSYCRTVDS